MSSLDRLCLATLFDRFFEKSDDFIEIRVRKIQHDES